MSDEKNNSAIQDRQKIDLEDPDEVRGWALSMDVSEGQLIEAVRVAGIQASKVREYLNMTLARP